MCVGQNPFIRPLRMRRKETRGDRARHWIVSPLQEETPGMVGLLSQSFALIDRREKLISTEIGWIDVNNRFKGNAGFRSATQGVKRLAQLPGHLTIAWILLRQPGEFAGRFD